MRRYLNALKNWRRHLGLLFWLGRHTKPFWLNMAGLFVFTAVEPFVSLGMALTMRAITDNAIAQNDVRPSLIVYVSLIVVTVLVTTVSSVMGALVGEYFSFNMRKKIYGRVLRAFTPRLNYHSGDIMTRLTSDVGTVAGGLTEIIPQTLTTILSFLVAFGTLIYFDWRLTLVALVLGPLSAVISVIAGKRIKEAQVMVQESESAYRANMQETIANMVVIKAFEAEDDAQERFNQLRDDRMYWIRKRIKVSTVSRTSVSLIFQLGGAAVFAYGAFMISAGTLTMGTLMLMVSLVSQLQSPVSEFARIIPRMVSIVASAGRIRVLEDLEPEDFTRPELQAKGGLGVEISDMTFSYGKEPILAHANLSVAPGQFLALMGTSGIGKTTLIRLILALYMPGEGCIELVDDNGTRVQVNAGARSYMSYVPQGNTLFSGSIADNLRKGKPDATEEEMWEVLRVVAADGFVRETSDGLETALGERGGGLSEGQAQRIAIARALIRRAPLLILDEATSALDEETELRVMEHLLDRHPRPTCILITHRQSVLRFCDRCVHIQDRELIERPLPQLS
jgi:ABC-type multidrug transport system fused ATPase/permease subunit